MPGLVQLVDNIVLSNKILLRISIKYFSMCNSRY